MKKDLIGFTVEYLDTRNNPEKCFAQNLEMQATQHISLLTTLKLTVQYENINIQNCQYQTIPSGQNFTTFNQYPHSQLRSLSYILMLSTQFFSSIPNNYSQSSACILLQHNPCHVSNPLQPLHFHYTNNIRPALDICSSCIPEKVSGIYQKDISIRNKGLT
jgi:hypothetical protein